jgi:hypothetical protein
MKSAFISRLACAVIAFSPCAKGEEIKVSNSVVDVQYETSPGADLQALADRWVRDSGHAVANYYGKFPVPRVTLHLTPHDGDEPTGGHTSGWNGVNIEIGLGRSVTHAGLVADWILPHEMIHTALPNLRDRHHWLEEGLATYVEPVARARVGLITPAEAWSGLEEGLPQGLPKAGDHGLDHTHTWGRTYWGGALFCLRADVEIRKRTGNQRGLEHALRAILAAGGSIETSWEIDRVISVADAGSGVPAFRELYDEMKAAPDPFDLPALWKQLGVVRRGDTVVFKDDAPLAAIRKAITGG